MVRSLNGDWVWPDEENIQIANENEKIQDVSDHQERQELPEITHSEYFEENKVENQQNDENTLQEGFSDDIAGEDDLCDPFMNEPIESDFII